MRFYRILGLCTLFIALISNVSCKKENSNNQVIINQEVTFTKEGNLKILKPDSTLVAAYEIEIADNDYEIQTGLMYRSKMREDRGMLFIFEEEEPRYFYMKNTEISLDLLYINKDNVVVSLYKNAMPLDEATLPASNPATYVFEINGGLIDKLKIEEGYLINFSRD